MRYHLTPSEWSSSKSLQTTNAGERVEKREQSCTFFGNKLKQPLQKTVWRFLKKLGIKPYEPAIPLLGIYPEETKIENDTSIPLFISALFTIDRTWKQPRCLLTDEWIKKSWYIYTMVYYSVIKRKAFESVLKRWMKLEPIIQSEVRKRKINIIY